MSAGEPFGRWLQRRREALDLTRDELARRVGCAEVTIRKIERGERRPSRQIAALIAGQLDLTPSEREGFVRRARGALALTDADEPPAAGGLGLPLPTTPLVGRERELAALRALLLRAELRLLTVVGMAGVGKTRVALQLASELADSFADGVAYVPLAAVASAARLPEALAQALELSEPNGTPALERLRAGLRGRQMLLVLDNFEQLLDGAGLLAELLAGAPGLKLLLTSRAVLRLSGEQCYALGPLALPEGPAAAASPAALERSPAGQLFVQRARASQADFALTAENAPAVAEICARLEGLPLALELAASWARVLSAEEIAHETRRGLDILSGGARDTPERQRSLRAVLDYSWDLLDEEGRRALRRLAVLPGSFGRAAAEVVGEASLASLAALIDHSLLRREGPGRYDMHPLVRQHAAERLAASGELASTRAALVAYGLGLAEEAHRQIERGDQAAWMARLEREHDTLRAALGHADAAAALRLAVALGDFWLLRGHVREGLGQLERALALNCGTSAGETLVAAELYAADMEALLGEWARALARLGRAEQAARALGSQTHLAEALTRLASLEAQSLGSERARARIVEAVEIRRREGDPRKLAIVLGHLGDLADMIDGDAEAARPYLAEAAALLKSLGDQIGQIGPLKRLGDMAMATGDLAAARHHHGEALALARALHSRMDEGWILAAMSQVAGIADDGATEAATADAAFAVFAAIDDLRGLAWAAVRQAWAAWRAGDEGRAAERFDAARAYYDRLNAGKMSQGWPASGFGHLAWGRGELGRAEALLAESLATARADPLISDVIFALNALGCLRAARGDPAGARVALDESLALAARRRDRWGAAVALEGIAAALALEGAAACAARLLGAAEALRAAVGAPPWRLYRELRADTLERATGLLGPVALEQELAAGRGLSLDAAIALARADGRS